MAENWSSSFYFPTSERCIAEFEILNAKLEVQLKADLTKVYSESLYTDLVIAFEHGSIQTHSSLLKSRAPRFFSEICSKHLTSPSVVVLSQVDQFSIEPFVREIYTQNRIEEKEVAIVEYLSKVNRLKEDVLTPESDIYVTPELTPTDVRNSFGPTRCVSDGGLSSLVGSIESKYLQATNTLYYSLVTVDEIYSSDSQDVLEKELAEQDQLFKSFKSIISRDSKTCKSETRSCTLSPVNKSPHSQNSLLKYNVSKKKQGLDLKLSVKSSLKDKFSLTQSENYVCNNQFSKTNSPLSRFGIFNKTSSLLDGSHELQNHEDTKLNSALIGSKQCKFVAMSRSKVETNEAMEAESVGPDSCLEAGSSGYLTGSSPKDHTASETFNGDLTEAATSEDMPHDNDQSARSSSMSSDVGTWDTTYPPASEITTKDTYSEDHAKKSAFLSDHDMSISITNKDVTANETSNLFPYYDVVHKANIRTAHPEIQHNCSSNFMNENIVENHKMSIKSQVSLVDHLKACSSQVLIDDTTDTKPTSGLNNFFIDAASLLDESEISSIPPNSLNCNGHEPVDDSYFPSWSDFETENKHLNKTNVKNQCENYELNEVNLENKDTPTIDKSDFEKRRSSLIRRNTFELELDGERLAVLRNEYERHKDKVLNKTNTVSSFNSTDVDNILVVSSEDNSDRNAPTSLPTPFKPLGITPKCDDEVHSPDSLNNDGPPDNPFQKTLKNNPYCSLPLEVDKEIYDKRRDERSINNISGNGMDLFHKLAIESDADSSSRFSYNNHISKDSNSKINQIEFTPIVSGGVSLSDLDLQEKSFSSPIMNRRKTEFAPILSGVVILEPESREEPKPKTSSSLTASWIIDMGGPAKSPPELRKTQQSDPFSSLNSCDSDSSIERPTKTSSSSLGFFIPLEDPIDEKSSADSGYKSSNFQFNKNESNILKAENMSSSNNSSSCGFYVDLNDENLSNEKVKARETSVPDKKLFSMFIDIGEPGGSSGKSKMNTPHIFKKRSHTRTNSVVLPEKSDDKNRLHDSQMSSESSLELTDSTEIRKNTLFGKVTDRSLPIKQLFAPSNCKAADSNKKQGFYMFIEADPSPVPQRRTLPSGSQPNSQRHSWSLETHDWTPSESVSSCENTSKQTHRRFHSVSVNKSMEVMFNVDQNDEINSVLPLAKISTVNSISVDSRPPSVGETVIRQNSMISSWHGSVKPSVELQKVIYKSDCKEVNATSVKSPLDSKSDILVEMNKSTDKSEEITYSSSKGDLSIVSNESSSTGIRNSTFVASDISNVANATSNELDITTPTCDVVSQLSKDDSDKTETDFDDGERRSGDIPRTPDHSISQVEIPIIEHKFSFVKLSDMDKEPKKVVLEEKNIANRMSRSIPEASWIENKMMTRSSTSRSLSRLFPHLNSSLRNKTPDSTELETDFSEISSMQSSMDPSALEGSTEETDASSGGGAPVSRLGEDLLRMFLDEISPDVTVEVGGRRIKAHKCILSSRCQYFAAILSGGWVESAGNVISMQGFSYSAVHFALCHIYSGASNIPDSINIVELATLADMLCLEGLKEVIMYTLKVKYCHFFHKPCPMCSVGVLECLPLAAAYGLDEIYRKSLRWITKYFVRLWPTKGFATLPRELLDKCYKQHIVNMNVDNVLETVLCCSKLQGLIPSVRWAEPVYALSTKLCEAAVKFISQHFCEILSSDMFMSLGKEQMWTMSHLEETLLAAAEKLPPDQACKSHSHLYKLTNHLNSSCSPFDMKINDGFVEFVRLLSTTVENCLLKQAARASRTPAWILMEPQLRHKIQDAACLVIVPGDDRRRARHLLKRGENSNTTKRSTDLLPSKPVVTETALTKKLTPTRAPLPTTKTKPSQATNKTENSGPRPKTWPYKMSEVKSRYLEPKQTPKQSPALDTSKQDKTNTLTPTARRNVSKSIISSSDSSRTSSPATRRALPQRLVRVSGKDILSKPDESLTMSTDSLADASVNAKKKEEGAASNKITKVDSVDRIAQVLSVKAGKSKGSSVEPARMAQGGLKGKPAATVTKVGGDKPKYSPVILSKRNSSQSSPIVKHSPVPPVKSTVNSTPSPSNRHNTLSPKEKLHVIADTKSSMLKRNSTYRVQAKSSSPLKAGTVKTKELAAISPVSIKEPKGNINRIQPKGNSSKKSTSNNNILNNNKTETKPQPMVGSRSGTFLKDEPTILKKPQAVNVSE